MFNGKILLITGGTGSFGQTVLHRFLETDISEIRIFSRDEKKQDDLRSQLNCEKVKFYIGDVRDYNSISNAVQGVDYLFHAAALKQVPSCEYFPMEAIKTNVLGTENTLRAAVEAKVKNAIVLSTDKAVYPINAMGISKAMMEKVAVAMARESDDITICGTRYGNVMASRGSVIPIFVEKIKAGHPLLITDYRMTRFLMTLDEAVDLVLFAFEHGNSGDIFVQKAPASTVKDLAIALKELFGVDNDLQLMGIRHSEKLHEALMTKEELVRAEEFDGYFRIPSDDRSLNYEKYESKGMPELCLRADYTSENTRQLTVAEIKDYLLKLPYIQNELTLWNKEERQA